MDEDLPGGEQLDEAARLKAFRAELVDHCPALYVRARQLTRNLADAADLAHDTFERALMAAHRFRAGSNMAAWLTCIMRNLFRDACRSKRLRSLTPREIDMVPAPEPYAATLPDLIPHSAIVSAIAGLRPFHQKIVQLAYGDRLSHRAIAERLNIPQATAGVRLWRARVKIRRTLETRWGWVLLAQEPRGRRAGLTTTPADDTITGTAPGLRRRARMARQVDN